MPYTAARAITRAREILKDAGTRYPTTELVDYLNEGIAEIRRVRPDLFIGGYAVGLPQVDPLDLDEPLPTPDSVFVALAQYVAGRAEWRDDEWAVDGRAATMQTRLVSVLLQGV